MTDPAETPPTQRYGLSATVFALGAVSLLTDVAADMVTPYLGVFLTRDLGAPAAAMGLLEGAADSLSALTKYLAGKASDRGGRRSPWIVAGYALANTARPLLSLASAPWHVFAVRLTDRVGKGLRTAPRDALLAASVHPSRRATAFGIHRGMDNLGAVFGPLCAIAVLQHTHGDLRAVFAAAAIPGALAVLTLRLAVREGPARAPATTAAPTEPDATTGPLPGPLRAYLGWVALLAAATASDTFLLLRAADLGVATRHLPLLWGGLSLLRALTAAPGGRLADRIGPARAVNLGWALRALAWMGFGLAQTPTQLLFAMVLYGSFYGLTEGTERALVASLCPPSRLGRAFGAFNLVTGALALPASLLFGALYPHDHGRTAFVLYGAVTLVAAWGLRRWRHQRAEAGEGTTPPRA